MNQEKLNLVNEQELATKSYDELLQMEKDFMHNKEATDLDLAVISATIIDKELEMGIFKGYTIDEVFGELLEGTQFAKSKNYNKRNCKVRTKTD